MDDHEERKDEVAESLNPSQRNAISHVRSQALSLRPDALSTIHHVLHMSNLLPAASVHAQLLAAIRRHATVAIHFHPDRPVLGRRPSRGARPPTVVQALLEDGLYRNQFETGISNGSVSAHAGGARDAWEHRLFGGAYHADTSVDDDACDLASRPKYGALDLLGHADGPAPRFGSAFLRLRPNVTARCTFTFGGSQDAPRWCGTADELDGVLAAVLEESFVREGSLGSGAGHRPPALVARMLRTLGPEGARAGDGGAETGRRRQPMSRNLDEMIEAQVHGAVRLDRDVAELVADPSFRGSATGDGLAALASRYGFPLRWHGGSRLLARDVPDNFRGPTMPSLAARVARSGTRGSEILAAGGKEVDDDESAGSLLDAAAIGRAAQDLADNPEAWRDRGSYAEVLQELKLLWHVLVRYGEAWQEEH